MDGKGCHSWRAVNDDYSGIVPMHERVRAVYNKLVDQLQKQRTLPFSKIIPTLNRAPFGMNDYSVFFMLCLLMENMSYTAKVELNGTRYNVENWAETVLSDKKIDMRQLGQAIITGISHDGVEFADEVYLAHGGLLSKFFSSK